MSDRAEVKLTIKQSFSDDGINVLKISPFGVIPSDIHIVNESISILLISLTLAPLAKTQLKSEFLPILLRVNAYQCCISFCFSTEQNRTNRVD